MEWLARAELGQSSFERVGSLVCWPLWSEKSAVTDRPSELGAVGEHARWAAGPESLCRARECLGESRFTRSPASALPPNAGRGPEQSPSTRAGHCHSTDKLCGAALPTRQGRRWVEGQSEPRRSEVEVGAASGPGQLWPAFADCSRSRSGGF